MICPKCGARATCLETRGGDTTVVVRSRFCENNHLFQTLEMSIDESALRKLYKPRRRRRATTPPAPAV